MGKPKAPTPPDPRETGAAATGTNVGTAIANAMMGNVNQITPDGSLNYSQSGTHSWTDPYTGHTYDIPTFTAEQTLSPENQAIRGQLQGAEYNLANIANDRSGFLRDYLGGSLDTSGVPGLIGSPGLQESVGGGYDTRFNRNIGGNFTDSVGLATSYAGADDFSADRQRVEDALWERGASNRGREEEALRTRLLNSGLREGSSAWNAEMERLGRQVSDERIGTMLASGQEQSRLVGHARDAAMFGNDANLAMASFGNNASLARAQFGSDQQSRQNDASMGLAQFGNNARMQNAQFQNSARAQGMQEAYAARAQPLNEVIGLMSGAQIQQPNFVNANMPTIPTTDVGGLINNHYNQQMGAWQQQQAGMGGLISGLGSLGGSLIGLSDDDAKKDKKKVGEAKGMGLYEFRYKNEPSSQPKHIGLMASDVEKKKPSAVRRGRDGLRRVDYGKALGLMGAG